MNDRQLTINLRGRLWDLSQPRVMGILNATPDSFFESSRAQTEQEIAERANQIVAEGGEMIDVGAYSTRPGAAAVSEEEEMLRLRFALAIVRREQPESIISVDTFRPQVARMAVEEYGVDIINDVSGGNTQGAFGGTVGNETEEDPAMFRMVAALRVPYIYMSRANDVEPMLLDFARQVERLRSYGQKDIILDPGFGFGKTVEENYQVMARLEQLAVMNLPLLVGVSRKSMIWKLLDCTPEGALNGTTVLNTIALEKGAAILRVHDVRQAVEAVRLVEMTKNK
jgi:dihydropteroate synthase